jgi:hypothetical protein
MFVWRRARTGTASAQEEISMSDESIVDRVVRLPDPGEERVARRAAVPLPEESDVDDAEAAARALLADSDARTIDPATRDLTDGRVERRTSEDATPPVDAD